MANTKVKNKETRCRNWTIVVYPDSAPVDWENIINEFHIEWVKSPLHDKDLNATGEVKKAHWHVLLMFSGVKAYEQVQELIKPLNCTIPERVHNSKALVRYMAHLDNPEKAQYSISDIVGYGGVDIAELLRPSSSERYTLIKEMIQFISDNCIMEFKDLMDYSMENKFDTWFPLLCDNSAFVVDKYIKSNRYKYQAYLYELEHNLNNIQRDNGEEQ